MYFFNVMVHLQTARGTCMYVHLVNPRISADCSTTKPIAQFSRTPHVQQVYTKAEFVHLTTGLLGL